MGVEVAVVVEEDLSEVDVVVGVPAEDGLAAAVLNGRRYRVDDRVQVAALVVPLLGDRTLISVRRVPRGAPREVVDSRGVESRCIDEPRMVPGARGVGAHQGASLVVATLGVAVINDGDRGRVVRRGAARLVVAVVDKDDGIPRAGSVAGTRVGPGCSGGAGVGAPVWGGGGRGAGGLALTTF